MSALAIGGECQNRAGRPPAYTLPMTFAIGIATSLDHRERWRRGREYLYLDRRYSEAVAEAGALPLLLPVGGDPLAVVEVIDALVLPGGDDFVPPYGSHPNASPPYPDDVVFDPVAPAQLACDRALLQAARTRGLPILGICYGAQLMALESGGSLHHHLPLDLPEAGPHQLPEPGGRHRVRIESGTRLASLLGDGDTQVNSLHHQCVARVGEGMRVSARAEDGVIEAIEADEDRFEVGVQWHPEKLEGPVGARLFEGLIAA
ncbi:MAG TPA: gamma-glutamyl-gamma-aminobutyrate hydrolase family protein, partial [Myxococcales bacterium]|nr:gamma-glutamyl-gamma-aminobutyrate hydrolase family protein [Myxococcales bacterium]